MPTSIAHLVLRRLPPRLARSACLLCALVLTGCAANPVTGKKELHLVSQDEEVSVGQQQYGPSRQGQGGDMTTDSELTKYVQDVGRKLAAVSDRQLPYEFSVLNNSVPNAWALPGGKIVVNRGLLTELHSEGELAAVLGHEIVHAAARHGAQSMERSLLVGLGLTVFALSVSDNKYASLLVGGAQLGAQLITTRYGRDAESEADHYGMVYMSRAGYDPAAAIELQRTFVKLHQGQKEDWLQGLFSTHPPSEGRVAANQKTAQILPPGGEVAAERYAQRTTYLRQTQPAYAEYERGVAALKKGDLESAIRSARQALSVEPREAKFHELLGDVEFERKNHAAALPYYQHASELNPTYFKPYLQMGLLRFENGDHTSAEPLLARSIQLLPTAIAHYDLGLIQQQRGRVSEAVQHFQTAAGSDSEIGKRAAAAYVRLDLPKNLGKYVHLQPQLDEAGNFSVQVANGSPVTLGEIRLLVGVLNANASAIEGRKSYDLIKALPPGGSVTVATGLSGLTADVVNKRIQLQIQRATVVDQ